MWRNNRLFAVSISSSILRDVWHRPRLRALRKRALILDLSPLDNCPAKDGSAYVITDWTISRQAVEGHCCFDTISECDERIVRQMDGRNSCINTVLCTATLCDRAKKLNVAGLTNAPDTSVYSRSQVRHSWAVIRDCDRWSWCWRPSRWHLSTRSTCSAYSIVRKCHIHGNQS